MSLIAVDELAELLSDAERARAVVVCDVRFSLSDHAEGHRLYSAGHIPGARFVDLHHDLADVHRPGAGRHPLPAPHTFAELLGRLGIDAETHVVAYDAAGGATAARLWWMLRALGHRHASVLDGGWPAWVEAGYPASTETRAPEPAAYPAPSGDGWPSTVTADEVAAAIEAGIPVVDSRAPERFRGDVEPLDPRAGHVPGAVNVFHAANVDTEGRMRSAEELRARFAAAGVTSDAAPIVYCGSGVTACHNLLAMARAGIDSARLYPGSWSEWSDDPDRPVATGDAP